MNQIKRAKTIITTMLTFTVALSLISLASLAGCSGVTGTKEIQLNPTVFSPAIGTEGVLRVGVDSSHAPYAGLDKEKNVVGIDVDVAAAIAEEMGLRLEIVDTVGQNSENLLLEGTIDMVMDVERAGGSITRGMQVGPYIETGPALFAVVKSNSIPEVELASLAGTNVAAQKDSLSLWSVEELIGAGTAVPYDTLEEAFAALERGEAMYAAADAVKGAYLALEYSDLASIKILGSPIGVYIAVSPENSMLAEALTQALRNVRDNGVLRTIYSKWLGPVSASVVLGGSAITLEQAVAVDPAEVPQEVLDNGEDLPDPESAG